MSRTYPQLTVRVHPRIKTEIDLLAFGLNLTQAQVIEKALHAFAASLPPATRKQLEGLRALRRDAAR